MKRVRNIQSHSKGAARLAVAGMAAAVVALAGLAVWSAIVTQNGASGLSQAGVQTSGHLRAVQGLSLVDTQTDVLGAGINPRRLHKLRNAQRILDDSIARMEQGAVAEATLIARRARPIMRRLAPEIERFLAAVRGGSEQRTLVAEERMDDTIRTLQLLLNDLASDPSHLLTERLDAVTATEHTVRRTAFLLLPIGLVFVGICAWMLRTYRRRSEMAIREALETTTHEALTDPLTGLANRRALLEELARRGEHDERFTLVLADLNGFKHYNDTFGHPSGDALLRRLSGNLETACAGLGMAARLGGDEFCVLLPSDMPTADVEALVGDALSEEGKGFHITSSYGVVAIPEDAPRDASQALHLADTRMYQAKVGSRPTPEHMMSGALLRMLDERHPGLGDHVEEVADLATGCAQALRLSDEEVDWVRRAAELHDVGKVAIPESILNKKEPLTDDEWGFIRKHTIIGERILGGLLSMEPVAAIVRSSHERWDGAGYPDRLAGDQIPIGARIVSVADAFCAMTEDRPYRRSLSRESALAELRSCSGTQFDPDVVDAFIDPLLDSEEAEPSLALVA